MGKILEIVVWTIAALFLLLLIIPLPEASSAVVRPNSIQLPDTAPIPTPRPNIESEISPSAQEECE